MTAVAVWDHRPSPDELLQARVASGWKPTPTRLQSGEQILGHAACLANHLPRREQEPEA